MANKSRDLVRVIHVKIKIANSESMRNLRLCHNQGLVTHVHISYNMLDHCLELDVQVVDEICVVQTSQMLTSYLYIFILTDSEHPWSVFIYNLRVNGGWEAG